MKEKMVTISFLYKVVRGKDDQYYKDKTFDEIYNSDTTLDGDAFLVEDYDKDNVCGICSCQMTNGECLNCNELI